MATKKGSSPKDDDLGGPGSSTKIGRVRASKKKKKKSGKIAGGGSLIKIGGKGKTRPKKSKKSKLSGPGSGGPKLGGKRTAKKR